MSKFFPKPKDSVTEEVHAVPNDNVVASVDADAYEDTAPTKLDYRVIPVTIVSHHILKVGLRTDHGQGAFSGMDSPAATHYNRFAHHRSHKC
jgi:hypothetical protein